MRFLRRRRESVLKGSCRFSVGVCCAMRWGSILRCITVLCKVVCSKKQHLQCGVMNLSFS